MCNRIASLLEFFLTAASIKIQRLRCKRGQGDVFEPCLRTLPTPASASKRSLQSIPLLIAELGKFPLLMTRLASRSHLLEDFMPSGHRQVYCVSWVIHCAVVDMCYVMLKSQLCKRCARNTHRETNIMRSSGWPSGNQRRQSHTNRLQVQVLGKTQILPTKPL